MSEDHFCITNPGIPFSPELVKHVNISYPAIVHEVESIARTRSITAKDEVYWLFKCIGFIDLTTLMGTDNEANVKRLCWKAQNPVRNDVLLALGHTSCVHVPAVCVYPFMVSCAVAALKGSPIHVASVATGFPSGQYALRTRLEEIRDAVANGALEIDIVVNRGLVLRGAWQEVYNEIREMKAACAILDGSSPEKQRYAHLKVILAVGELGSVANVYRASMVSMCAGADFVKTSTGKETVNATLPLGAAMLRAVRDYYNMTGIRIGFKPAGGIRTARDAFSWCILVRELLGEAWLTPELFRLGASALLIDIERQLYRSAFGHYASVEEFMQ